MNGAAPDAHRLDDDRLGAWLAATGTLPVRAGPGAVTTEKFPGGQSNPTYLVRVDGDPAAVLRKKPPGDLLPSAHAVEREYRVTRALEPAGVPVARPLALCGDPSIIGTPFFLMTWVEGRVFWDPRLPEVHRDERAEVYRQLARVLAGLHSVDPHAVGLGDYGRPGDYFARQINRWTRQYRASETEPIAAMDALIDWLPNHIPALDETGLVHGDYRIDNILFHPTEPRVLAVLDWELSTLGHPLADLSYQAMTWRLPAEKYRGLKGEDLAALGIPTEAEYVATYLAFAGREPLAPEDWEFAVIFNMWRNAAIRQGVLARALAGNASSTAAVELGSRGRQVAEAAWALVEQGPW